MELDEFHVFQRQAVAEGDGHAVTGQRVRVRGGLEDLAATARGEDDRLRLEHVDFAGGQIVGHDAGRPGLAVDLGHDQVEHVVLVEELDVVLDAVLVQRLENHVARAVRRVARTANGRLAVVARVSAEATLVDPALGGAVERQAHLFEVQHGVNGFLGHDLGGVLVHQVVAALDGVEGVPLPVVFLDIGQRRTHSALGRTGVRTGRVDLGQYGGAGALAGFDGCAHTGTAGTDDDHIVLVKLHSWMLFPC